MIATFYIKYAKDFVGKEVEVAGWVYNKRSSGKITFLQLRDGSGFIQGTVLKSDVAAETYADSLKVTLESSIRVTGVIKEDRRAPSGYEMVVREVEIVHLSDEFPIGKKEHGPDFLLSHRHLWLRSSRQWAILRIRYQIINSIHEFLHKRDFVRIDSPLITPVASEGTTTLFNIDYFGERVYLSQSGQLYLEAAITSFGRAFDFSPVLRAEKTKTRRHLIEFWMMDAEAAFMTFEELLDFEEELIYFVLKEVLQHCQEELHLCNRDTKPLERIQKPFLRLTFAEAVNILRKLGSDIKDDEDLGNDDETLLMLHYQQPVFVTHYPALVKAFYCKRDRLDESKALSVDLFAPEGYGEVTGGGEREADYESLKKRIKEHGYSEKDYAWYLDLRKYGSVPHSGFGLGLERLIAWICKLEHVRETIPFPRMLERFYP